MPEATVDVDDLPKPAKDHVGRARQRSNVKSVAVAHRMDQPTDSHFRRRVLRFDCRHDTGTLGFGNGVGHLGLWASRRSDFGSKSSLCYHLPIQTTPPFGKPATAILCIHERDEMDTNLTNAVRRDFLSWTGGFPPDSEQQIFIYLEYACEIAVADADEVRAFLRKWMETENLNP